MSPVLPRRLFLAAIAAAWCALGASPALAATEVSVSAEPFGAVLEVVDQGNDNDAITVSAAGGTITVTEAGVGGATAGTGCDPASPTTVTCPFDPPSLPPVGSLRLQLKDGTDSFTNLNLDVTVVLTEFGTTGSKTISSGPGDDQITTGEEADSIDAGAGRDFVAAGGGNDVVNAGAGGDSVLEQLSPNGADLLDGGPGRDDGVSYGFSFLGGVDLPLTLTLNGLPDDGHAGEGDNLVGFESLTGAGGDDTIAGDDSDNSLSGGGGNDTITGAGGDDEISPGSGSDSVDGGEGGDYVDGGDQSEQGADTLRGGGGSGDRLEYFGLEPVTMTLNGQADDGRAGEGDNISGFEGLHGARGDDTIVGDGAGNVLEGGDGDDSLTGAAGNDAFDGGRGDDLLIALGGRDDLDCGLGFDTAIHDAIDIVAGGCERRGAEVLSDGIRANRKGKARARIECPAEETATCLGQVVLLSNGRRVGSGKFNVPPGRSRVTTVRLTRKGRRILAKSGGSLLVAAEARTAEPQGVSTNAKRIELEAARARKRRGRG